MDASKKQQPQLFRADLFGSPSPGLSFGLGNEEFTSPLSLVPALETSSSTTTVPRVGVQAPLTSHSPSQPLRPTPKYSPQMGRKATRTGTGESGGAEPTPSSPEVISSAELSNVPLDSPTVATTTSSTAGPPIVSTPEILRSASEPVPPSSRPPGAIGPGWNDPPMLPQFSPARRGPARAGHASSEPSLDTSLDNYPIQPLANEPTKSRTTVTVTGVSSAVLLGSSTPSSRTSQVGPLGSTVVPPSSAPPPQMGGGGVNPYRMGVMGARKAAGGYISATGPPPQPISQPMMGGLPTPSLTPVHPPPASQPATPQTQVYPPPGQRVSPSASLPMASVSQMPVPSVSPPLTHVSTQGGGLELPVQHHWFFLRSGERYWNPFSLVDSRRLEESLTSTGGDISQEVLVPTDGGRYDVNLHNHVKCAVYWDEPPSEVRRCSWFYKGDGDRWYLPYDEDTAARLEEEYLSAHSYGTWNRRVDLSAGEAIIMHSPSAIVHYPASHFRPTVDHEVDYAHPKSVLRGFAEVDKVEQGEQSRVDHLVFVVHGIGQSYEELTFRSLVDCVDDFREVSQLMLHTHRFTGQAARAGDGGGRVEFLPIHWRAALQGDAWGLESGLKPMTLPSISRLRDYTNSVLLDILYYTSPMYCQAIVNHVAMEMNRMFEVFMQRNPTFQGGVSLVGHSLGACILFDLLNNQNRSGETADQNMSGQLQDTSDIAIREDDGREETAEVVDSVPTLEGVLQFLGLTDLTESFQKEKMDYESLLMCTNDDLKELDVAMGPRKKLMSYIVEQKERKRIAEERKAREEAERHAKELERKRRLQMEAANLSSGLLDAKFIKAVGGTGQLCVSYPQLNFQTQCLFAVGSPIGLLLTVRCVGDFGQDFQLPNCARVFNIFHPFDPVAYRLEPLVCESVPEKPVLMPHHKGRKRFHLELYENLGQMGARFKQSVVEGMRNMWNQLNEIARSHTSIQGAEQPTPEDSDPTEDKETTPEPDPGPVVEPFIGQLNGGRRIDYVLQEKPIEKLNEYLFALSSHLCYWRSEDTALLLLKEVYGETNPELIKT